MSQTVNKEDNKKWFELSTDVWAVLVALAFALLVRVGLIHRVPW